MGEQFNSYGKTFTKEASRIGDFSNGLQFLEKYTHEDMYIRLMAEKKGFFGYSQVGKALDVLASGYGSLGNQTKYNNYNVDKTSTIRFTWKQITNGHLAAFLIY